MSELFGLENKKYLDLFIWGGGALFGGSSFAVNSAIAAIATSDAMEQLANSKSSPSSFALYDIPRLMLKVYFVLGYGLTNGGMALEYPFPVDNEILGITEAVINFIVYLGIGNMAFDNFFNKIKTGAYANSDLFLNAKKAIDEGGTLEGYYETLSPNHRIILIKILEDYRKWAFQSLRDFFNMLNEDVAKQLFLPEIKAIFEIQRIAAADEEKQAQQTGSHSPRLFGNTSPLTNSPAFNRLPSIHPEEDKGVGLPSPGRQEGLRRRSRSNSASTVI